MKCTLQLFHDYCALCAGGGKTPYGVTLGFNTSEGHRSERPDLSFYIYYLGSKPFVLPIVGGGQGPRFHPCTSQELHDFEGLPI